MRYFKIKTGYGADEFVPIDETELEKAYGVFLTDGKGVFKNGVVRGQDIISITEDWHKALGVSPKWKLTVDDWNEITKRGIESDYKGVLEHVSHRVQHLIQSGQQNLIGKNVPIPEIDAHRDPTLIEGSKKLAEGMKMPN